MFLTHPRRALALPLLLACSATASAQTAGTGSSSTAGGIIVNPIRVGDMEVNTMFGVFVGIDACASTPPADVVFDLDSVPADKVTMDVYTGTNCNSIDRDKADEGTSTCTFITTQKIDMHTQDLEVKVPANLLFKGGCDNGAASETTLWFIAVDESQAGAQASKWGTIPINVDGDPPTAPTNVTGGSGESLIRVGWQTSERDLLRFIVYIDNAPTRGGAPAPVADGGAVDGGGGSSTSPDGECGSTALTSGGLPADLPSSIRERRIDEATATGIDLTPEDIGGDRAVVAVSTVDKAGNRSPLSNLACVAVVPTESFWDRYKANGGEADGGCACRTSSASSQAMNAWPIGFVLLALMRRARKRVS